MPGMNHLEFEGAYFSPNCDLSLTEISDPEISIMPGLNISNALALGSFSINREMEKEQEAVQNARMDIRKSNGLWIFITILIIIGVMAAGAGLLQGCSSSG